MPTEERRSFFSKHISVGNVLTMIIIIAGGVSVYTQIYADVAKNQLEISQLKQNASLKDSVDKDNRNEMKQDIRDVKASVKDLNDKIDKILFEVTRIPKPPATTERPR